MATTPQKKKRWTAKRKFDLVLKMLREGIPLEDLSRQTGQPAHVLWEIRMKGRPGIARAIYVTEKNKKIVVLHAFVKKTQKTPKKARIWL